MTLYLWAHVIILFSTEDIDIIQKELIYVQHAIQSHHFHLDSMNTYS
jgi:hypothetical protein